MTNALVTNFMFSFIDLNGSALDEPKIEDN